MATSRLHYSFLFTPLSSLLRYFDFDPSTLLSVVLVDKSGRLAGCTVHYNTAVQRYCTKDFVLCWHLFYR